MILAFPEKTNVGYKAYIIDLKTGVKEDVTSQMPSDTIRLAVDNKKMLYKTTTSNWRVSKDLSLPDIPMASAAQAFSDDKLKLIKSMIFKKPESIQLDDLKWRLLCRSIVKGKNTLITGVSGCGKSTIIATSAAALNRPCEYITLAGVQDIRETIMGNVWIENGTMQFRPSKFLLAVQKKNNVIIIDEINRFPDPNLLFSILQERQIRVDLLPETPIYEIAEGVTFIAAANIGYGFSSTFKLDAALLGRFPIKMKFDWLDKEAEIKLMNYKFSEIEKDPLDTICSVAEDIRAQYKLGTISEGCTTRQVEEACDLILDGYTIWEVCNTIFINDEEESDKKEILKIMQKHEIEETVNELFNSANLI